MGFASLSRPACDKRATRREVLISKHEQEDCGPKRQSGLALCAPRGPQFRRRYPTTYAVKLHHWLKSMGLRCEYEAPEFADEARPAIRASLHWHSHICPSVFDKESGVRLQLTEDEQAALEPLVARMSNGSTPFEVAIAFDAMVDALFNRRLGYSFEWDRLARRSAAEWNAWLNGRLRPLRW